MSDLVPILSTSSMSDAEIRLRNIEHKLEAMVAHLDEQTKVKEVLAIMLGILMAVVGIVAMVKGMMYLEDRTRAAKREDLEFEAFLRKA